MESQGEAIPPPLDLHWLRGIAPPWFPKPTPATILSITANTLRSHIDPSITERGLRA